MIFYFSGTGNSRWVATQLGKALDEKVVSIANALQNAQSGLTYDVLPDEKIIFVFPVHSWGPAVLVPEFIEKMTLRNYTVQPVYVVCTCGDECGYTAAMMRRALATKKIVLTKAYSIIMPNNYILLPGFDTDPKDVMQEKLRLAPQRLQAIVENIQQNGTDKIYTTGRFPILKSDIIYPLFKKFNIGRNSFYAKDNCTSCALCVQKCPTQTIAFVNGHPRWADNCVQCLACIHYCPVRAIEYGKISRKKGRYHHP